MGGFPWRSRSTWSAPFKPRQKAFAETRKLPAFERQKALAKIAAELTGRAEEFAQCISAEAGKPIRTARGEVERAAFCFKYAAEETTRLQGELLPLDVMPAGAQRLGMLRRFPLGPVAAITPFNFPLNLVAHKLAPAMAAGCTMVLKPATKTPMVALMLADVVARSGYPQGAVSILPMTNQTAAPLIEDERFKLLTFTGSSAVGWSLKARAGKKKVALELGGNAGCIVHSDADLDKAVARCVTGGFAYAGQSCISVQRILVERSVFEQFAGKLTEAAQQLRTGDPFDDRTDVGPMIQLADAERAEQWIAEAVARGRKGSVRRHPQRVRAGAHGAHRHHGEAARELPGDLCAGGDRGSLRRFRRGHRAGQPFAVRAAGRSVYARRRASAARL